MRRAAVTGACGFIGAWLVRRLAAEGLEVAAIDNLLRGRRERLAGAGERVQLIDGDVRDEDAMLRAFRDVDIIFHLAAVNGTENFYTQPELVLDVGVRGAIAVARAAERAGVTDLIMASSAEVYQTPPVVPTDENIPLMLPDSLNPRYAYGGSKIITELVAFTFGRTHFRRVQVFRPHNIYGPDMGYKHVIPQFIERALGLAATQPSGVLPFEIHGDGSAQRAFCYIEDAVEGLLTLMHKGGNREIYHIGNPQTVSMAALAHKVAELTGRKISLVPTEAPAGQTAIRQPDIGKIAALGYQPATNLDSGLEQTFKWYRTHLADAGTAASKSAARL